MNDVSDTTYRVTADELRQFIERIERLDAEKTELADQQKEDKFDYWQSPNSLAKLAGIKERSLTKAEKKR